MAFNVANFSNAGRDLLAQLSTSKALRIKNIYVDQTMRLKNSLEQPPAWWASIAGDTTAKLDVELSAAGVIDGQARLVVRMALKPGQTRTVTAKTIVLTACGVEGGVETPEITFCGISDNNGLEVLYNASGMNLSTSVAMYFKFNDEASISFESGIDPDFVVHSELDRFVSCHPSGDTSGGENQTIGGTKTFRDSVVVNIAQQNSLSFQYSGNEQAWIGDTGVCGIQFTSVNVDNGTDCFKFCNSNDDILKMTYDENGGTYTTTVTDTLATTILSATTITSTSVSSNSYKLTGLTLERMYDGICIDCDFMPNSDREANLGLPGNQWYQIYGYIVNVSGGINLESQEAYNNKLAIYEDEGDICFNGLLTGHGLVVGQMYNASTHTFGDRGPIHCGKLYGSLVTTEYKPTASIPTIPNSTAHTDAPSFINTAKMIVMAIPCWATCRSLFLNRRSVGEIITVNAPTGTPPYMHSGTVSSDPENGAWFVATWKCGRSNSMGHYEPLSTMDPSTTGQALFSYLPAGQYRLLNCVDEITSLNYAEYNPNGVCMMLQKVD